MFRGITDESEIDLLVSLSAKQEPSRRWVADLLNGGASRPQWCRMAWSDENELLAAHVFDSWTLDGEPGDVPTFVQLLGHVDAAAAVALLVHDLSAFGCRSVDAHVVVEAAASPELRAVRLAQPGVLEAAGFERAVDRVRLSWPDGAEAPRPAGTLTFRPAATFAPEALERLFAEVGDGSVDHGMRTVRAEVGREQEAVRRLGHARHRDHAEDWFVVGIDASGEPVGYVQSAMLGDDRAALAEIGVAAAHRGRGHADDLLAYGTAVVRDAAVTSLVSDTDQDNRAMRAAFARAGYIEFATRHDFRWRAPRCSPE
jgi:ribosomal protein S18 acetylase RimI-like enzyme